MDEKELQSRLTAHQNWVLKSDEEQADLRYADLEGADLEGADLEGADLRYANLRYADLRGANLRYTDLRYADLLGADLQGANLQGANLIEANLKDANLIEANLQDADLWGTKGNMVHIKSIFIDTYAIVYTDKFLYIGCEMHPIEDWWGFDDTRVTQMDDGALEWWQKWKPVLQRVIAMSPAEPTGYKPEDK